MVSVLNPNHENHSLIYIKDIAIHSKTICNAKAIKNVLNISFIQTSNYPVLLALYHSH